MYKKITVIFIILICILSNNTVSYAQESGGEGGGDGKFVKIEVNEKIPGANCELKSEGGTDSNGNEKPNKYECKVGKGTKLVTNMLGEIIKYFTYIALLVGVAMIVYSGILYSMGGLDESLKETAKTRIKQTLIGLLLLLCSGYILQTIAPWIYK